MGGMQALQWADTYPEMVRAVDPIATTSRLSAQSIASRGGTPSHLWPTRTGTTAITTEKPSRFPAFP